MFQLNRERAGAEWEDLCYNPLSSTSPLLPKIYSTLWSHQLQETGIMADGRQIAPTSPSVIAITPDNGENEIWWQISAPPTIRIPQSGLACVCVKQCMRESTSERFTCETTGPWQGDRALRSIIEEQATTEGILWRWETWQADEAILLNQANSNLFCRTEGRKWIYFQNILWAGSYHLGGGWMRGEVPTFNGKSREGFPLKKQTLKYI